MSKLAEVASNPYPTNLIIQSSDGKSCKPIILHNIIIYYNNNNNNIIIK